MQSQIELMEAMERDFQITRKLFLNLKTGWYDNSKGKSNLVSAKDISLEQIQGRYRLNMNDNMLKVQEFFFDIEWSPYTEDGIEIKVITKEIANQYFPRLKRATKKLLFPMMKYISKDYIYIRVSGTGLHIVFFLKGLSSITEWELVTKYFIHKSKLQNTKNATKLVFGLDKDTILSSERKIAEFGSWNKLKKDFKGEVDYLNYATYLSVNEFLRAKQYPFCNNPDSVKYPAQYKSFPITQKLLNESKNSITYDSINKETKIPTFNTNPTKLASNEAKIIKEFVGEIPVNDPACKLTACKCYWNILRDENATWYARQFLVKFLKYALKLNREQILDIINKYHGWSDYNPRITAFYVNKHFRKGTCETKVMKPPRKMTLMKYGLCDDKCKECVYANLITTKR